MAAWFGSKKQDNSPENGQKNGNPQAESHKEETAAERVTVTESAYAKVVELIGNAVSPVLGIRIIADAPSPMNPQYSLAFVQEGEDFEDDTIIENGDFKIYIDADSLDLVEQVSLDFITTGAGGGFRLSRVVQQSMAEGPVAEKIQKVIDDQINPALAMHGGNVQLLDVKGSTAYIELGGGCKGCGMVDVTLKQGIEVMIKQNVPEITEILDATDHASGNNPYYQPSK